ncbi:MAG: SAM-dependent methyltransferase [Clostridia bacterium]|nr:SAM-dependent methyltransferase [Clostridia bacterium]
MIDLLELQKQFILAHLKEGDIAVDFTMGNGGDTVFLSNAVGASGKVYAFDLQEEALVSTKNNLVAAGAPKNYTLICASHHRVREFIAEPFQAGMFNLGYLPGGSKKGVTTKCETTLPAVQAALDLLSPDGVLLVAVYPGHKEGEAEGAMLFEYFATLNRYAFCASKFRIINSPSAPYFFVIEKRDDHPVRHPGKAKKNARRAERLAAAINEASEALKEQAQAGEQT